MSLHELVLGGLPVDGLNATMTAEGWWLRVMSASSGTAFGTSEAVMSVVDAMGADGGQARINGHTNATTPLQLQVVGVDATALAKGEAAVRRVLPDGWGAPVDLLWRPSDGRAPASVRTVLTGVLGSPSTSSEWDRDELRLTRTFPLTLTHEPHVRSEHYTVTPALPAESPVTVVDDCSSAAGWSATDSSGNPITPTVVSGTVRFSHALRRSNTWVVRPAAPMDFAATPWLVIDARLESGKPLDAPSGFSSVGGRGLLMVGTQQLPGGFTRFVFDARGMSGAVEFLFSRSSEPDLADFADTLTIDQLGVSATRPSMGKQIRRIITVGGTERTPGTLTVSARDGVTPLGLTLAHTCPDDGSGYDPDLHRWASSGGSVVTDAAAPMGSWRLLDATLNAVVPQTGLPQDTYQIGALIRSDTLQQVTLRWSAWAWSTATPWNIIRQERIVALDANTLTWVPLGRTTLPATRSRRGATMISLEQTAGAPVNVGGWYALRAGRGAALTVVDADEPHLFIEAGQGGGDPGSWLIGTEPDGSDAYVPHPSTLKAPGVHTFPAGPIATYFVTAGTPDPAGAYGHYHRWTANAADDGRTT